LVNQRRHQCGKCRYQVWLTSVTILHRTKVPLAHWFWTAYLMTLDKRGVSALLLQRQLGLTCYETAWMMLHKLRRAMVNVAREPLRGEVEVDDTWIGGEQAGLWGEPTTEGQAGGCGPGRRRKAWPSFRPGSHECDSGLQGCHDQVVPNPKRCLGFHGLYRGSQEFLWSVGGRFKHLVRNQPLRSELRKGAKSAVPLADRAIETSNSG
jgi:hypothetical protein